MQIKGGRRESIELHESGLGKGPKGFDAVDMVPPPGELVLAMMDAIMLFVTQVHQAVVASPAVGVNYAFVVFTLPLMMACRAVLAQSGTISM